MITIISIGTFILLVAPIFYKERKYREIERQRALRRTMLELQEKHRHYSL